MTIYNTDRTTVQFAGKLARVARDGTIEISRLVNARSGEYGWFPVRNPTPALQKAVARLARRA